MSSVDRRTFLKTSTAAAVSASTGKSLAQAPSNLLNFALVGGGEQGRLIASHLLKSPGARLAAICEINPLAAAEAKKLAPEAVVHEAWAELYANQKDLQAVVVALPEHAQAPAAVAAMQAGLDVYCEAPMAYSPDQAKAVIAARDEHQRILQIGQQRRSNPLYYLAERLIQKDGVIGEVSRVDVFWDRGADWRRPAPTVAKNFSPWGYPSANHLVNWRLFRAYSHGLMTENALHQLDAAGWLVGNRRPKAVCGMGAIRYGDQRETHDMVTAEYMHEGDVVARCAHDLHQSFDYGWGYGELFLGSEGALRITAEQQIVVYDKNRRGAEAPIASLGPIELGGIESTPSELEAAVAQRAAGGLRSYSLTNAMRIFTHCVRTRTAPSCTAEIGGNALVAALVGAEAQQAGESRSFSPEMFV